MTHRDDTDTQLPANAPTAGLWSFDGNCGGYITDEEGVRIARAYAIGDVRLIVEAVNTHRAKDDRARGEAGVDGLDPILDAIETGIRCLQHYGANDTEAGRPHPQALVIEKLEAAAKTLRDTSSRNGPLDEEATIVTSELRT